MKLPFVFLVLLVASCSTADPPSDVLSDSAVDDSASADSLKADTIPAPLIISYDFSSVCPDTNYVLMDSVIGDLNLDNYPDAILVYQHESEEIGATNGDRPRPFVLLLGDSSGNFIPFIRNDNIVYHEVHGQMFGEAYAGTEIDSGTFRVNHYGGSRFRWTADYVFEYDPKKQTWYYTKSYASMGDMLGEMNNLTETGQCIPYATDTLILDKPIDLRKFDNRTADVAMTKE